MPVGDLLCNLLGKDLRKLEGDSSGKSSIPLQALDDVKRVWAAPDQQKTFSHQVKYTLVVAMPETSGLAELLCKVRVKLAVLRTVGRHHHMVV